MALQSPPPADHDTILATLATTLTDAQLVELFPAESPAVIRQSLREMAVALSGRPQPAPPVPGRLKSSAGTMALYCDGASRGNPGEAAAGLVIVDQQGTEVVAKGIYLGQCTNNMAEYRALLLGLQEAQRLNIDALAVFLDSELVVRQLNGVYRVKDEKLKPLYTKAAQLLKGFRAVTVAHVRRNANQRADQLANQAIDQQQR